MHTGNTACHLQGNGHFVAESPGILTTQKAPHPQLRLLHYGLEYSIDPSTHFNPLFRQSGRAAINLRQNSPTLLEKNGLL